ncbi:MAG: hypothetical protein ABIG55_01230 [Candidatus Omnitrophota bacterium]
MKSSNIPEEIMDLIENLAKEKEYDVVDIATKGGASFIEVVLDKKGGITLDECARFNSDMVLWIGESDLSNKNYTVEVSSPGLDRELKSPREFLWAAGKQVKITMNEPLEERFEMVGELIGAEDGKEIIVRNASGKDVSVKKKNIKKIKLHI